MSVDDRLRSGLGANARSFDPDVERALDATLRRHRHRGASLWRVAAALGAAACTLVVLLLPGRQAAPGPAPAERSTSVPGVVARFSGRVAGLPTLPDVAGQWVLGFRADGTVSVEAPRTYGGAVGETSSGQGRLRTSLFQQDLCSGLPPGLYTMTITDLRLSLAVDNDLCADRATILTRTTWTFAGPRIPDGQWSRDITSAAIKAERSVLPPEWFTANHLDDGKGRFVLQIAGDRWTLYVEDDVGGLEVGDRGTTSYDTGGRWLQSGLVAIDWSLNGDTLRTSNATPLTSPGTLDPDVHFALEGTWTKVP